MRFSGFLSRQTLGMRPPRSVSRNADFGSGGVAIHYAGPGLRITSHAQCIGHWLGFQRYHMDTHGWVDVAYSAGFCIHGYAFAGRGYGIRTAANGTDDANYRYLAIVFIGGEGDTVTKAAIAAAWWLIHEFREAGAGQAVRPHSSFKSTACPAHVYGAIINNPMSKSGAESAMHDPINLGSHALAEESDWSREQGTFKRYVARGLTTLPDSATRVVHRQDLGWLYTKAIAPLEELAAKQAEVIAALEARAATQARSIAALEAQVRVLSGSGEGAIPDEQVARVLAGMRFVQTTTLTAE